jgi:hypothetical protein
MYYHMSPAELSLALEMEIKQAVAKQNKMQPSIEAKISEQQNIEEQMCEPIVITDDIYEIVREFFVPAGGQLRKNRVIPDIAEGGLRELSEIDATNNAQEDTKNAQEDKKNAQEDEKNAQEDQKFYAAEDNDQNTEIAQVLFEDQITMPFNCGETTSLITLPFISSSLESGGTSLISSPIFTSLSLGPSIQLPTPSLHSTPSFINLTSTTGGTASAASSADNPCFPRFPFCMPLLPPRTGIGVPASSPPPTASSGSTGVYAFASQASPKNVADNPDNPDLGFDTSGTTPDNPRKPAPDLWAYVASRG